MSENNGLVHFAILIPPGNITTSNDIYLSVIFGIGEMKEGAIRERSGRREWEKRARRSLILPEGSKLVCSGKPAVTGKSGQEG